VGDLKQPSFGVLLDAQGMVVDHIKLNHLHGRNRDAKKEDHTKLLEFLGKQAPPDVVAVSGWSVTTKNLMSDVREIIDNFNRQESTNIPVILARDEVARIYQTSKRSIEEFPSFGELLKYTISVGRCLQDPLYEYASMFNHGREILLMSHHSLQHFVRLFNAQSILMIRFQKSDCTDRWNVP
jgi:transcription elongation factor SPT6